MTHNDVVCIDLERLSGNADTVARSSLSGNGDIRCTNVDRRLQTNDTADVKHHDTGTTLFAGPTERTRAVVVQVGNGEHLTAASAKSEHTAALSSRESRNLSLAQVVGAKGPRYVRTSGLSLFYHNRKCHFPSGIAMRLPLCFLLGNKLFCLVCQIRILCTNRQGKKQCYRQQ